MTTYKITIAKLCSKKKEILFFAELCTDCTYHYHMSLEWNYNETTEKNSGPKDRVFQGKTNLDKHGIDFADAATVFDDSNAVTIDSA
ncbi:MAG: BrnT family toxin [Deltaproteobacteria bacterium]|nr:BrnT family toxin [Deltaproteobacteria bacterium]MBW2597570.1 BrnT family toxin [Deltaproteobacteria bacterium]RLC17120.1 MAG: hypothetical protein DRI24_06570 [Deltaproteobacteria bacterium]